MVLSVLIVSYNTRELTLACLRSLYQQLAPAAIEFDVIVVDNASSDGSASAIAAEFPQARLIASPENLGFAAANNLAAQHATGEYLLLLNPDTVVIDSAIAKLLEFASQKPQARIWGGRTLFADHSLNPASCWGAPTPWSLICVATGLCSLFRRSRVFNPEGYGGWKRDSLREVDIVSGCFLLIHRELWQQLGGFDPEFFMYGEDADLCLRARAVGAKPMVTPHATIIHYGGASERVRADKMVRLLDAKVRLIRRHWRPRRARLGVTLLKLWPLTRALAWRTLALVRGEEARQKATSWQSVWERRRQWAAPV